MFGRAIDPLFAVGVGVVAAAVRVNREEKEKGQTTEQTVESLKRRVGMLFGRESASAKGGG